MAAADTLFLAELRREQLLDVLEGNVPQFRSIALRDIEKLAPRAGEIAAIWCVPPASGGAPLPQVIVGDAVTLEDLFAWSATYLRRLGPLTAQSRVLTADQLLTVVQQQPSKDWWVLAGGAVAIVLGEVLALTKHPTALRDVSLMACRSTLSNVLLRAGTLGAAPERFDDFAESWEALRGQAGGARSAISRSAAVQVARALFNAGRSLSDNKPSDQWFASFRSRENPAEVANELAPAFGLALPEASQGRLSERTAEERVKLFDEVAPVLRGHSSQDRPEKAFALALFAFLCRPGFSQQLALLAPQLGDLPEAALWLGAMQVRVPMAEALAEGDGIGWRLARDLHQPLDVFSAPNCDIAISELRVLLRGKGGAPKFVKSLARLYMEVELYPGVVTVVRTIQSDLPSQPDLPMESPPPRVEEARSADDMLFEAERAVQAALRFLRNARSASHEGRYGGRRSRR